MCSLFWSCCSLLLICCKSPELRFAHVFLSSIFFYTCNLAQVVVFSYCIYLMLQFSVVVFKCCTSLSLSFSFLAYIISQFFDVIVFSCSFQCSFPLVVFKCCNFLILSDHLIAYCSFFMLQFPRVVFFFQLFSNVVFSFCQAILYYSFLMLQLPHVVSLCSSLQLFSNVVVISFCQPIIHCNYLMLQFSYVFLLQFSDVKVLWCSFLIHQFFFFFYVSHAINTLPNDVKEYVSTLRNSSNLNVFVVVCENEDGRD